MSWWRPPAAVSSIIRAAYPPAVSAQSLQLSLHSKKGALVPRFGGFGLEFSFAPYRS